MSPDLVLASTSRYRADLLGRLGVPFATAAPDVDETARAGEPPGGLATRLARLKAETVAQRFPGSRIIGSDQVAVLDGRAIGKPLTVERCIEQLLAASGRSVTFLTAVCLLDGATGRAFEHTDTTRVVFRPLGRAEVTRYVDIERPLDCAGGFKCEGLGIALFERIESTDPTALIGLPLIWLAGALRQSGLDPLTRP